MALLGPLFLLGLLGVAIPLWLHRLETQVTEREPFATTMFLEPAKKRIHVKKKLKYLLLMALRILFFVLLVLAFARPVFYAPPQAIVTEESTHHVIVMDTSFSMQTEGYFDAAREAAENILSQMEDDDIASLYSASTNVASVVSATSNPEDIRQGVDALAPGNGKLDLGSMISSLNTMIEASQANFVLHVISDFQQTGQAVRFADMIPDVINGRPVSLEIVRVVSESPENWAIDSVVVNGLNNIEVGIRGFARSSSDRTVSLSVNGELQQEIETRLQGEGITFVTFENAVFAEGDNRLDIRLTPSDSLAGDDLRHTVFDNSPPAPVLLLTDDEDSLGVTYITAALETAPRGYEVILQSIEGLDPRILQRYPWIVIEDIGAINASLAGAINNYISGGGAVLAASGESVFGLSSIPVLGLDISSSALGRESRNPITMIDSSHPALSESAGWSSVNVRSIPVEITDEDRVLVAQANEQPVLLERTIGRGKIMLLATALDNSLSDLPVKPVFVTFMAEAARYLSNENLLIREQIGESFLQLSVAGGASGQVYDPDGESLLSLADTTQAQDISLDKTGYYQVFTSGGEVLVAVNPDRKESDLAIMDAQVLQNWQNVVAGTARSDEQSLNAESVTQEEALEEREIWRLFLFMLVIIVLAESILGNQHLRVKTGTL